MARESKPFRDRNPVAIGAVSLAVIAALVFLAFNAQSLPFIGGGTVYKARSREAAGLKPDDPVRVAGVKVGKVESLALEARRGHRRVPGQGRLRRRPLRGGDQDRDGAGREVRRAGAPGRDTLDPDEADPPGPDGVALRRRRGLRRPLHDGRRTSTPPSWPRASRCSRQTFSETPDEVRASLHGLARLSDTIACRDQQLQQLLAATRNVTAVLADRNGEFTQLIMDSNTLLTEVQRRRKLIDSILTSTQELPRSCPGSSPTTATPAHAGAAAALAGHRHPVPQPGEPRPDGERAGALRPGLRQHPGQRPLVRQLVNDLIPTVLGAASAPRRHTGHRLLPGGP